MFTFRMGSLLILCSGLLVGGCAGFSPAPLAMKSHIEPVMRTDGVSMSADQHYLAGRGALLAGNLASARMHFMQALLTDPGYVDAINGMAAILTVQGRYSDSLELMRQATVRDPDNEMYRRNLARVESLARTSENPAPEAAEPKRPEIAVGRPSLSKPAVVTLSPSGNLQTESASREDHDTTSTFGSASIVQVGPSVFQLESPSLLASGSMAVASSEAVERPVAVLGEPAAEPRSSSAPSKPAPRPRKLVSLQAPTTLTPPVRKVEEMHSREPSSLAVGSNGMTLVAYSRPVEPSARLMISNGMGREGWAAHNARLLEAQGISASRITNYRHYGVEQTMILFREGQRSQAERIMEVLPTVHLARLIQTSDLPAGVDIRLVLGRDSND